MSKKITIRPRASQDIDEHYDFIAQRNSDAALQFFDAVRLTIAQIARMPGLGSIYRVRQQRLQGMRKWAVKGFKKYLIFYLEHDESIEVVRILYASQNIESILGEDSGA
ncbi:type II toxin-antitoxin system RelE/ParE family toxin [Leptolyngbya sp. BC1307]|uniref:type II toxin-antitoxin system RelE/ParE family toxin n=1 Tax=Leptolyngbya sp. BC1307 TaxID=2029589 RepID=UPI000EFBF022|nr:type II toxin-antitoxin system RelE/ParE family toxin [Leptolyngbya sp. BC1307]